MNSLLAVYNKLYNITSFATWLPKHHYFHVGFGEKCVNAHSRATHCLLSGITDIYCGNSQHSVLGLDPPPLLLTIDLTLVFSQSCLQNWQGQCFHKFDDFLGSEPGRETQCPPCALEH